MKALLLAGGTGSRLQPLTFGVNKHLLPVGKQPMIGHALSFLSRVGIHSVAIVTTPEDLSGYGRLIAADVHPYNDFDGIYLTVQHKPQGIADAIHYGEAFVGSEEPILVMLADNIYSEEDERRIADTIRQFDHIDKGCHVWTTKTDTPETVGVLAVNNGQYECIEKPQEFVSDLAITGLYLFDHTIWDKLSFLEPSNRGEYEITDLLNAYVDADTFGFSELKGSWLDLGQSLDQFLDYTCKVIQS
jgi:glucose-1-phosphate thymidylyltransferase